jgi:hypothetical protein
MPDMPFNAGTAQVRNRRKSSNYYLKKIVYLATLVLVGRL